jgi:hypothetical protein
MEGLTIGVCRATGRIDAAEAEGNQSRTGLTEHHVAIRPKSARYSRVPLVNIVVS